MGRNPMGGFPTYYKRVRHSSPLTSNEPISYEEISREEYQKLTKNEVKMTFDNHLTKH
jgi:hypothetical protein